ncbi:MAG: hypothetical protein NTU78_16940 [Alphaproteobacteria bacterium]|nr:hypothetical protein [Alphaproteobacteria bacterium]
MTEIKLQSLGYETVPYYARKIVFFYGLAAINWAKLEQQLDALLHTVNLPEFDGEKYRETPNTSFRMKCDLFEKWFVKDSRFSEFHSIAARLHRSLKAASQDRQLLFHSAVQEFIRGDPNSVKILNMQHCNKRKKITVLKGNLSQAQVEQMAIKLAKLTNGMAKLCRGVMTPEFRATLQHKP